MVWYQSINQANEQTIFLASFRFAPTWSSLFPRFAAVLLQSGEKEKK
jgi:hypothetical protein